MNRNRLYSSLFALAVLGVCAWVLLAPWLSELNGSIASVDVESSVVVESSPVVATQIEADQQRFLQWAQRGAALGERPASLRGTVADGGITVNTQGELVPDLALRRLFDYFLASAGEESPDAIQARIAFYLQQHAPLMAAVAAWSTLQRYLEYKEALSTLPGHDGSYDGMQDTLLLQRELRDSLLGPELRQAFFQAEDEYADFALQHSARVRDESLSSEERERLEAEQLAALTEATRTDIVSGAMPVRTEQQVEKLREQGAGEGEIQALREQQLGSAAAERLAALDEARAEWERRYQDYRAERDRIEASALARMDRDSAIQQLRADLFSPQERKRVEALDRIASQPAPAAVP